MSALDRIIEIARRDHTDISNEHLKDIWSIADKATAELAQLRRGLHFPVKVLLQLIKIGKMRGVEYDNMQRWIDVYGDVK